MILIFGVGIYWYTRPKEVTSYTPEFETSQTKKESEKNTGNVEAGIQIPGYKTIIVAAGTKDVSVELVNPEENNVYFEISFYLPETRACLKIKNCTKHVFLSPFHDRIKKKGAFICQDVMN